MTKRAGWILGGLLVGSLMANAYLFVRAQKWQQAWTEQILTTSLVEWLYKKSGVDVSYQSVKHLVATELGEFEELSAEQADLDWAEPSARVISVDGTKLIFKDGQYVGSRADLPAGLEQ